MRTLQFDSLTVLYNITNEQPKSLLTVSMHLGFSLISPELVAAGDLWDQVSNLDDTLIYDSSVAKPTGEFFAVGTCYPPGGKDLACPVSI